MSNDFDEKFMSAYNAGKESADEALRKENEG